MLAVVFDMDGVLFDTQKVYVRTWHEVADILKIENFEEPLNLCIGTNKADQIEILKTHCGENFPFERFYALKEEIFTRHIAQEGVPLMRGTLDLLKELKKMGAKVAIASSSREDVVRHNLEVTGLAEYFDVIVGGNMVEHSKPSPDIYLKACDMLSVNPSEAYAVEDSYNGVYSAVSAGLKTIMVPDCQPPKKELDDIIFKRFESLYDFKEYLTIRHLMERLWEIYPYASVLCENKRGKRYSVSAQGIKAMSDKLFCAKGYVIKAYNGKQYTEYSFNGLSYEGIDEIISRIADNFKIYDDADMAFEPVEYGKIDDNAVTGYKGCLYEDNPEVIGDKVILSKLKDIRKKGMKSRDGIMDCLAASAYQISEKTFISNNTDVTEIVLWMTGALSMMSKKDDVIKNYFKSYSNLGGAAVLEEMEKDIPAIAECTVELLEAETIKPGKYECICTPEVTGMIVHEAFGHGVEMDMFVKDRALAERYIGEYVASPLVTMHDGAAAAVEAASYGFDDEGMRASDTVIIEKGILKRGINDSQTSLNLGVIPTGNGRRENYEHKAYTRMTNTFFEGGKDSLSDMIASIKYGFMLENATCGMEDPKNWGIQCMVNVAREIADGKFTGKIYSPIVLSGYVPELLKSITMMSENVKLSGGGFCGKGYKEWVKVSDGGPYIKATIDLG